MTINAVREKHSAWESHEKAFAAQVIENVRRYKKKRKLTTAELSARLSEAGWPINVNTLNGILGSKGRRSFSVPEIVALSTALSAPGPFLMFPLATGTDAHVSPGREAHAFEAFESFQWPALAPIGAEMNILDAYKRHLDAARMLGIWNGRLTAMERLPRTVTTIQGRPIQDEIDYTRKLGAEFVQSLADIRENLRAWGAIPPPVADVLVPIVDGQRPLSIELPIDGLTDQSEIGFYEQDLQARANFAKPQMHSVEAPNVSP